MVSRIEKRSIKYLPKSEKGEERKEEERELAPQATPRVFWFVFFFLLALLVLEELELRILFDLEPEFADRDESKLIFLVGNFKLNECLNQNYERGFWSRNETKLAGDD